MNWYKKSKLVNKGSPQSSSKIYFQCCYCHRWGTHPIEEKVDKEETIWKTYDQLNSLEKEEVAQIPKGWVSHVMCSYCVGVFNNLRKTTDHPFNTPVHHIKELSLNMK